jgi:hypothetical protein
MFAFTGTDNFGIAGFGCSIDGSNFSPCTSPITYTNLKPNSSNFYLMKTAQQLIKQKHGD